MIHRKTRRGLWLAAAAVGLGSFGAGHTLATDWTNAAGGDWATPGNWDAGVPTSSGSDAIFNLGESTTYTVNVTSPDVGNNLLVDHDNVSLDITSGQSLSLSGGLNIVNSDGTLTVSGGTTTVPGMLGCAGTFNLSSGAVSAGTLSISGLVNFSGGSLTAGSITSISSGQLNWTGGTLSVGGEVIIGPGGLDGASGNYRIQQIGLTDAAHQSAGASSNTPIALNNAGQVMGTANRYSGGTVVTSDAWLYSPATSTARTIGITDAQFGAITNNNPKYLNPSGDVAGATTPYGNTTGFDTEAWFYSAATNSTQEIGLTDPGHIVKDGYPVNVPFALNAAGQVAGYSLRAGGAGLDIWFYSPATNTTQLIGLTGAGYGQDSANFLNDAGQVAGDATRFNGSTPEGQDAWLYSSATNTTQVIGLTDAAHSLNGGRYNTPQAINAAGQVVGLADRYSSVGMGAGEGFDTWLYSPSTNTSQVIGLTDAAHTSVGATSSTEVGGYSDNRYVAMNASGQVTGYATRFNGSFNDKNGQDAWVYSPSTNTTQLIGLTDAGHTRVAGYWFNTPFAINSAGQVVGTANRYSNGVANGQDAWLYSPSTNTTQVIGLTDAEHTGPGGISSNSLTAQNAAGLVAGVAGRYSGSLNNGMDAWIYDPSTAQTFSATLAQVNGFAYSQIKYLSDSNVAVGDFDVFNGSMVAGTDAFAWTEAGGFVDLGSLVSGGLTAAGWANLADVISVNATGTIVGDGGLAAGGQGAFTLTPMPGEMVGSGMQLIATGNVDVASGAVLNLAGGSITAPAVVIQSGGALLWRSGTLNITGAGSNFGGTLTVPSGGLLKLDGAITDPLAVSAGGVFDLDANTGSGILVRMLSTISILPNSGIGTNGQVNVVAAGLHANRQLIVTGGLTIAGNTNAWQGQVDLANNDMIIHGEDVGTLANQIHEGFTNGTWSGAGIVSTSAAGDSTHLTTLGYRSGGILFDGVNTTASDVLVKYTYFGDADLNGTVDGSDYHQIDMGFGLHLTGWSNGDFNYDGVVDGSDYALIDNAFNQLRASGAGPLGLIAAPTATSEVPEPGEWEALGLGVGMLATRRRRVFVAPVSRRC